MSEFYLLELLEQEPVFQSRDAGNISKDIIEELICRFLINLPQEELEFPRLMINIRTACFFYEDNYFSITPETNNQFQKKFAKEIFKNWPYLVNQGYLSKFDKLWIDYKKYIANIPSYGAIILNDKMDKILFNIYLNYKEEVMEMLDFPKGKAN